MELSKENQEWLDINTYNDGLVDYVMCHIVKEKLLQDQQKIEELEKARNQQSEILTTREKSISTYRNLIKSLREENFQMLLVISMVAQNYKDSGSGSPHSVEAIVNPVFEYLEDNKQ